MGLLDRHALLRWVAAAAFGGASALALAPASAQGLLPEAFFNAPFDATAPTAVEADELIFDAQRNIITARGDVVLGASGYVLRGQDLVYRRGSGELVFTGAVSIRDPAGNVASATDLKVTGGLKQAFLNSIAITSSDGARITADSAEYDQALRTILDNASYAPCGDCIDAQGRRIGWSVSASRVVYNADDGSVSLENPTLALLGVPVAWLPYLWLPDLSDSALEKAPRPSLDYSESIGLKVEVPLNVYSTKFTDVIFTPTLLTRQGFLLGAEWVQRFDQGSFRIKASGLYQFDKNAFTFADAQRDWRGALQTSGEFVPVADWKVGFAYAAFTDSAYFEDYRLDPGRAAVNEVYATHLTADTYLDARVQQFNLLGANTNQTRAQQGIALPNIRVEKSFTLPPGAGRIDVEARLLGISRQADSSRVVNGVTYDLGYAGTRLHGMAQLAWQNQMIGGGFVATPFLGGGIDGAHYDNTSLLASAPHSGNLWGVTPIAALDVRYPMAAHSPGVTHLIEPIGQIVYRGAASSKPGITNEDSQSVVLDDTNVFTYNRFTGIDRQETGLRANIGGRYLASFDGGDYLEVIAGQSFLLAGTNAFALPDSTQAGVGSGLEANSSYAVLGAYAGGTGGLKLGGKAQIDTAKLALARVGLGASYSQERFSAALNYRYTAAVPAAGMVRDQNEIGAELTVPVSDYWSVSGSTYWDLNANSFLQVGAGLMYDDGYLQIGAGASRTGATHIKPNDTRVTATFRLKAPAGFDIGYTGPGVAP